MSTYLDGLGISMIDQSRVPSTAAFPRKFNPFASSLWAVVLSELTTTDPELAWELAIQRYLDLCQSKEVYPFREQAGSNQAILTHLSRCRSALVRALSSVHQPLMEARTVLRVQRRAELSARGFTLCVSSTIAISDPTFGNHLRNSGFVADGLDYQTQVDPDAWLKFRAPTVGDRWCVSYVIKCTKIPETLNRLVSKNELEDFIVKSLWFPLTREARPDLRGPRFI